MILLLTWLGMVGTWTSVRSGGGTLKKPYASLRFPPAGRVRGGTASARGGGRLEIGDSLADLFRRLCQGGLVVGAQRELDDLLDPSRSQDRGHTEEQVLEPILPVQARGDGKEALLVAEDRLRHLHGRGGGGVERAPG